uniref:Uncharacterized protein n=1 Tax=Erpetoichthys calabaricus TaxID=27687 RepID=A0A8C4RFB5_ERPCA
MFCNLKMYELTCFMCLQIYSYPVSLSCTHSFCLKCIQDHFKYRDDTEKYSCPECYAKFEEKPRLLKNTDLSEQVLHLSHVLVEPSEMMALRRCKVHREMLKLFCRDHRTCICTLCSLVGEHKQHMVCTVEEAKMEAEVRGRILKYKTHFFFISGIDIKGLLKQKKRAFKGGDQHELKRVQKELQVQLRAAKKQYRRKLEQKLQNNSMKKVWDGMKIITGCSSKRGATIERNVERANQMNNFFNRFDHPNSLSPRSTASSTPPSADTNATTITLDPSTANEHLILSEDRTIVRYTDETLKAPYGPKRFDDTLYVMGSEGFNFGRHYWEVITRSKTDWEIGLAYASLPRKGKTWLGRNNISWSLECNGDRCMVWHNNISIRVSINYKLERVGVYLDYTGGTIAFYDAEKISLLHSFHNKFTEAIYPVLNPCNSKGGNFAPLTVLQLKGLL